MVKKRNKLLKISKRMPSIQTINELKYYSKMVKTLILRDTKDIINANIKKFSLWKGIEKTINFKSNAQFSLEIEPNEINDFYINVCKDFNFNSTSLPTKPSNLFIDPQLRFNLKPFEVKDIVLAWKGMKNHDSLSVDPIGICNRIVKYAMESKQFIHSITSIFNLFAKNGEIPLLLKTTRIVPVPKSKNAITPNDTRPISIQPVFTKLLDKCIYSQVSKYFEHNNLFSNHQFGFRRQSSTSHALMQITDFLYESIDSGEICALVALDLQKAFDSVNRDILLEKLSWYGIECKLIKSLLTNRAQYVQCNDKRSETKQTKSGISQGAASSTLWFSIYINDLPLCVKNSNITLFADDSSVYNADIIENIHILKDKLEYDLFCISKWLDNNKVKLNVNKTQCMLVGKKNQIMACNNFNLNINGNPVAQVKSLKILGVVIDELLSFSEHCQNTIQKCYRNLSLLYPLKRILCLENKIILVNALIFSVISYAICIWGNNLSSNNCVKVDNLIKQTAKYVLNKLKYDHVTTLICNDLEWLLFKYKLMYDNICMAYKMTFLSQNEAIQNYLDFTFIESTSTRRSQYRTPNIKTTSHWGEKSFKYKSVLQWLQLPDDVLENMNKFTLFKKKLMSHILSLQNTYYDNSVNIKNTCDYSCIEDVATNCQEC